MGIKEKLRFEIMYYTDVGIRRTRQYAIECRYL